MKGLKKLGGWMMAAVRFARQVAHVALIISGFYFLLGVWAVATGPGEAEDNASTFCRDVVDAFNEGRRK